MNVVAASSYLGCSCFQLSAFRDTRVLRQSPAATLDRTGCDANMLRGAVIYITPISSFTLLPHISAYLRVYICMCIRVHVEVRGHSLISFLRTPSTLVLSQSFSVSSGTHPLADWPVSTRGCLSLLSPPWGFAHYTQLFFFFFFNVG